MKTIINILKGLVVLIHGYVLWFEMFAWETRGKKVFVNFDSELFTPTKELAANLGLYNGFLAAGLIWTFFINNSKWSANISLFFLSFIFLAGIYGSVTTTTERIFWVQSIPALVTFFLIRFNLKKI